MKNEFRITPAVVDSAFFTIKDNVDFLQSMSSNIEGMEHLFDRLYTDLYLMRDRLMQTCRVA